MKSALITGITGQDGAYLARFLLKKGYKVYGGARHVNAEGNWRLHALGIAQDISLLKLDLLDTGPLHRTLSEIAPDETYNLAAHSSVESSFRQPVLTGDVDALGPLRILEAIREHCPHTKFFQASSAEMFGRTEDSPQTEDTPFRPGNPYGAAKLHAHWNTVNYRNTYSLHSCSGILYNHESPLRGEEFVTRKITLALSRIKCGSGEVLELGNLSAQRDWGFAGDYVEGMWQMLQAETADDYILATGVGNTVKHFVDTAAKALGLVLAWEGDGLQERAVDRHSNRTIVQVAERLFRPADTHRLVGSFAKVRRKLGWRPVTGFESLAELMIRADYDRTKATLK